MPLISSYWNMDKIPVTTRLESRVRQIWPIGDVMPGNPLGNIPWKDASRRRLADSLRGALDSSRRQLASPSGDFQGRPPGIWQRGGKFHRVGPGNLALGGGDLPGDPPWNRKTAGGYPPTSRASSRLVASLVPRLGI